ncbi:hypothetical protein ACFQVC_15895 [Streptomyces monticola]|uniref:Site-specific DNA-methyltransferase (adenine-specific) n=1 Tax=Streptomyces monticola TaxID=2666263 RepID=A0ABW2JIN2_9ACTN
MHAFLGLADRLWSAADRLTSPLALGDYLGLVDPLLSPAFRRDA